MAVTVDRFMSRDYPLTGDISEVPHIARVHMERLAAPEFAITSTYQLIGHFLSLDRNEVAFADFLGRVGIANNGGHRNEVVRAISTRVANVGVKILVAVPAMVDGKPISSKLDDAKATKIKGMVFTNALRHDFPGVGLGNESDKHLNASMTALRDNGITTTNQLFGAMLKHLSATPTTDDVVNFWKELGHMGVAHSYKTTLIEAMKQKLDIGIDNAARAPLAAQPEEPRTPEEPTTPERPLTAARVTTPVTGGQREDRTLPAANVPLSQQAARAPAPRPSPPSDSNNSTWLMLLAGGVAITAFVCYQFMGSSTALVVSEGEWI